MPEAHPLDPFIKEPEISVLAERVGCSPSHLRNLAAGRKTASLPLAMRLSEATGIPVEEFEGRPREETRA